MGFSKRLTKFSNSKGLEDGNDASSESGKGSSENDIDSVNGSNINTASMSSQGVAARENRLVHRSKCLVYLVILLSAAAAGTATYFFMQNEEEVWYADELEEFAEEVFESTRTNLIKLNEACSLVADSWVSEGAHGLFGSAEVLHTIPNVTIPNFGIMAQHLLQLGGAEMLAVAPLVSREKRIGWEAYMDEQWGWLMEDQDVLKLRDSSDNDDVGGETQVFPDEIYGSNVNDPDWFLPIAQVSPTPFVASESPLMMDLFGLDWFPPLWEEVLSTRSNVYSDILDDLESLTVRSAKQDSPDEEGFDEESSDDRKLSEDLQTSDDDCEGCVQGPKSVLLVPLFSNYVASSAEVSGVVVAVIDWTSLLSGLLEDEAAGMLVDLEYSCPDSSLSRYAFQVVDEDMVYIGTDFEFNEEYAHLSDREVITPSPSGIEAASSSDDRRRYLSSSDEENTATTQQEDLDSCVFYMSSHASDEYVENWQRDEVVLYTIVVISIFVFTVLVFFVYDELVRRRNKKITERAEKSTAIVTALFPKNVAAQMLEEENHNNVLTETVHAMNSKSTKKSSSSSKPIASLFRESTIMFADIAGFTAWSSMREPTQVFRLLETVFNSFDAIADRHKVFKVETVGDCYVCVCGVPDPMKDHAVAMARFAQACLKEMGTVTKQLEHSLGPDTSTLQMRFGIHSGSVTAGVLRGQRARFQLFGDTMNKASRIETSGKPGCIHLSAETADLLKQAGFGLYVTARQDKVELKGLGELSTFWLRNRDIPRSSGTDSTSCADTSSQLSSDDKPEALSRSSNTIQSLGGKVAWHTQVLSVYLNKIVACRRNRISIAIGNSKLQEYKLKKAETLAEFGQATPNHEIIFNPNSAVQYEEDEIILDDLVVQQLHDFVKRIEAGYNPNKFHNFDHASHVVMSVVKLIGHMESTSNILLDDPVALFTMVLTGLVHDVDHPGVSNQQLVNENDPLAAKYFGSIAERNSLDFTWSLLRQEEFLDLRKALYQTPEEFEHFRELFVHAMLVTDIADPSLQKERVQRWDSLFGTSQTEDMDSANQINKKKTALLEHIIQASDVAHVMQHWSVYKTWNGRLFDELKIAYQNGRASKSPEEFWFKGEFGFFDYYIIPLARRLGMCPAIGAAGDELLQYAVSNRREWETKGEDIVAALAKRA